MPHNVGTIFNVAGKASMKLVQNLISVDPYTTY